MGARLIIVSNRVAVPETKAPPQAGGMAVAVKAALKNRNGIWFGWSGKVADPPIRGTQVIEINKLTYVLIDLSKTTFRNITTASPTACCGRSSITASTCRSIRAPTRAAISASTACSPTA